MKGQAREEEEELCDHTFPPESQVVSKYSVDLLAIMIVYPLENSFWLDNDA